MNLALFHGLKKSQMQEESTRNKSMIFIYQAQEKINASSIYKRNKKYQNKTKIEHACK